MVLLMNNVTAKKHFWPKPIMERVVRTMSLATRRHFLRFLMVLGAIAHGTDNYLSFISVEGLAIVVGGTIANSFMSYQATYVIKAFTAMWHGA